MTEGTAVVYYNDHYEMKMDHDFINEVGNFP